MGYSTYFSGTIEITPQLPQEFVDRWNKAKEGDPDHQYAASSGPSGHFQGGVDYAMLFGFPLTLNGIQQPEAWCGWDLDNDPLTPDYTEIRHDGGEKFYEYGEWLQYLVAAVRAEFPDSRFTGSIEWDGEESRDIGRLDIRENFTVREQAGIITYREEN